MKKGHFLVCLLLIGLVLSSGVMGADDVDNEKSFLEKIIDWLKGLFGKPRLSPVIECNDGIDNDGDGRIDIGSYIDDDAYLDLGDNGCLTSYDRSELVDSFPESYYTYEDVLLICNPASQDSLEICNYFMTKRPTLTHRLDLQGITNNELVNGVGYDSILQQVGDYLNSNPGINYIVTTKGVPLKSDKRKAWDSGFSPGYYSVDSMLAFDLRDVGVFGPITKVLSGFIDSPYEWRINTFSKEQYGFYIVTRLDGYNVNDVKALIDRAGNVPQDAVNGLFVIDDSDFGVVRAMSDARNELEDKGYNVLYSEPTAGEFIRNANDVIGYHSFGGNDPVYKNNVLLNNRFLNWVSGKPDNWNIILGNVVQGIYSFGGINYNGGIINIGGFEISQDYLSSLAGQERFYIYAEYAYTGFIGEARIKLEGIDASGIIVYENEQTLISRTASDNSNGIRRSSNLRYKPDNRAVKIIVSAEGNVQAGSLFVNEITLYQISPNFNWKNGAIGSTYSSYSGRSFSENTAYIRSDGGRTLIADLIEDGITGVEGFVSEPTSAAVARPYYGLYDRYTKGYNLADSFYTASDNLDWKDVIIGDPKTVIVRPEAYAPSRDWDVDGIFDVNDNCPRAVNFNQEDCDSDGIGDVCDSDVSTCEFCQPTNNGIEICDSLDNDCNEIIDDVAEIVTDIYGFGNTGICLVQIESCVNGVFGISQNAVGPSNEVCDGLDNNCDGSLDEGCLCGGGSQQCGIDTGECAFGTQTCSNGIWGVCTGNIVPSAEICDGKDNDCDNLIDEGVLNTYYRDRDTDGYGDPNSAIQRCAYPVAIFIARGGDCDDSNYLINPDAVEICDGVDNNCVDGVDEGCEVISYYCDSDSDGHASVDISGSCNPLGCVPAGCIEIQGDDCDDANAEINPDASEMCNNIDDDCDTLVDEEFSALGNSCELGFGVCRESGIFVCNGAGSGVECDAVPGAPIGVDDNCNLVDENCDGNSDENYIPSASSCGVGICSGNSGELICNSGSLADTCNPFEGAVTESCEDETGYDGLDNNCDGIIDLNCNAYCDQDNDGYSPHLLCLLIGYSIGDCDDANAARNPGEEEIYCNAVDENCEIDDDQGTDSDSDGFKSEGGLCGAVDCNDNNIDVNPNADEICNAIDDDCDASIDEGLTGGTCVPTENINVCKNYVESCIVGALVCSEASNKADGSKPIGCNGNNQECINGDCITRITTSCNGANVFSYYGRVPLTDLGTGTYNGQIGGLYLGGSNVIPEAHKQAGIEIARGIKPLNINGIEDPQNGRIIMASLGMSNTEMEFDRFMIRFTDSSSIDYYSTINDKLYFANGAAGGETAITWADYNDDAWLKFKNDIDIVNNNVDSSKQVQIVWLKLTERRAVIDDNFPTFKFPDYAYVIRDNIKTTIKNLKQKYPNVKIVYLSPRTYGGYASVPLNSETLAYENGFIVKWVIENQINGDDLVYTGSNPEAPWIAWGPYLWADGLGADGIVGGVAGRLDGLEYTCSDFSAIDGTHPSEDGAQEKVAKMLLDFLKTDPTAEPWFCDNGNCEFCQPTNNGVEICDNLDNDCDSLIDEGLFLRQDNRCLACDNVICSDYNVNSCASDSCDLGACNWNGLACVVSTNVDTDGDGVIDGNDRCNNNVNDAVNSLGCPLPVINEFSSGLTTGLTDKDLTDISDFSLGVTNKGKIVFREDVSLIRKENNIDKPIDLNAGIDITDRKIKLDSTLLPELNVPAILTFYGISFNQPRILKDGVGCSDCVIVSYANNILEVNVAGFSTYEVIERRYCGDGICSSIESCSSCSADCGTCPVTPGGTGDGGSGGGSSGGGSSGGGGILPSRRTTSTNTTQNTSAQQNTSIVLNESDELEIKEKINIAIWLFVIGLVIFGIFVVWFVLFKIKNKEADEKVNN